MNANFWNLQCLKYVYDYQHSVSLKDIYQVTNYLPIEEIEKLLYNCVKNNDATIRTIKNEIFHEVLELIDMNPNKPNLKHYHNFIYEVRQMKEKLINENIIKIEKYFNISYTKIIHNLI